MSNRKSPLDGKAAVARRLARAHARIDPGITKIFRVLAANEQELLPTEPVKLLEVNKDTPANGVVPVTFGPDPVAGVHFSSVIVEVTPAEFKRIQNGELKLPGGWRLGNEIRPKQVTRT